MHLVTKHHLFRKAVHLRKGGHLTPTHSCPARRISAFAVRSAVCDCSPHSGFNWKRLEGANFALPGPSSLVLSGLLFFQGSLYCVCRCARPCAHTHVAGMISFNFHDIPCRETRSSSGVCLDRNGPAGSSTAGLVT